MDLSQVESTQPIYKTEIESESPKVFVIAAACSCTAGHVILPSPTHAKPEMVVMLFFYY